MHPQPLSSLLSNPTYDLTPAHIGQRPELAVLMAKAIAISAVIETQWGRLLAGMLGANAPPVIAMYQALSGGNAQRDALRAAAERVLAPEQKELFDALTLIARPLARMRNRLAHGGWGICHELPDALILQDPESVVWMHHEVDEYIRQIMSMPVAERAAVKEPKEDLSAILVFRKRDFEELIHALQRLRSFLAVFTNLLSRGGAQPVRSASIHAAILQQLLSEPEIVEAIARLRQNQKKAPAVRPQRPRKGHPPKS